MSRWQMHRVRGGMAAAVLLVAGAAQAGTADPHSGGATGWNFFQQYCSDCHNATDWAGGVAFDTMEEKNLYADADVWEEAVTKLRGRLMPPPGKPQPAQRDIDAQASWLEGRLDAAAQSHTDPGHVVAHRLNRTEYQREIKNLLDLDIDAATLLPKETKADGFDNVAIALRVSPSFLDSYIVAAHEVSTLALGSRNAGPSSTTYRTSPVNPQDAHVDGMPLGTRGGLLATHLFPADGEYVFNIGQSAGAGYVLGLDAQHHLIMTLDGRKVFEQDVGGDKDLKDVDQLQVAASKAIRDRFVNIHLQVPAGPHRIGIAFVARSRPESDDTLQPLGANSGMGIPQVTSVEIRGPQQVTGLTDTPSRRKIFICYPANAAEEAPCARQIVSNLARRAFRRPLTDADLAAPMKFFEAGRTDKGFEGGIQQAVMAVLASPKFLYRVEAVPAQAEPGSVYRISDLELASRLSFFLWSQGPDDALLDVAVAGRLRDPAELDRQVKRMLADPRANSLTTNFADQWFTVDEIDSIQPDPTLFPEFDAQLRNAFRQEIELFTNSVFAEDQNVLQLVNADYTFVNERLAKHYGIPNVLGDRFRRVQLTDNNRYGILGKGAFLMGMSYANRTSPVRRGAWVMEQLVGAPPHAPPPGVEALKENQDGAVPQTVRERMQAHRTNPTCNACHGIIDPIGFSLENFNAIGAWRTKDQETGTKIESDDLINGQKIDGPAQLRALILRQPDQFVQTLTVKLMTYALGRGVEAHDMPTVRAIVRAAASQDYRFSAIVTGIVNSPAFTEQQAPPDKS